jgi:hypothetical protein
LPYIQIEVEYILALPVVFNPVIHGISASDRRQDGCGNTFYGVGSSLTLGILIGSFSGGPIGSTSYDWHVSGAQITAGTVDEVTAVPTITIELDQPGTGQALITRSAILTSGVSGRNIRGSMPRPCRQVLTHASNWHSNLRPRKDCLPIDSRGTQNGDKITS